jgi:glutamate dehydrogenase (NAD(P)+)
VVCDPWKLSQEELKRLTRRFTYSIINMIGPESDIPAPDMNTNPQTMSWILDTYSMIKGQTVLGVVTGKPIEVGGSVGRNESTGRGAFVCMEEAFRQQKRKTIKGTSIAVQGFGNVGSNFAKVCNENGCKIVGVTDAFGGVYDADGLDIPKLQQYAAKHPKASVEGFPGADTLTSKELFKLDVDVLAPCALGEVITSENADDIKAPMIVEGANGPTTPAADEILLEKKALVLPDILANAGGVTVSYFEWVQDLQYFFWNEKQINQALKDILIKAYTEVNAAKDKYHIKNLRLSALALAVERVAKAIQLRGIFP